MNVQVLQRSICNEWIPFEGPDDPAGGLGCRSVFRRFDVILAAGQSRPCEFHQGLAAAPSEEETTQGTKLNITTFTDTLVLVICITHAPMGASDGVVAKASGSSNNAGGGDNVRVVVSEPSQGLASEDISKSPSPRARALRQASSWRISVVLPVLRAAG